MLVGSIIAYRNSGKAQIGFVAEENGNKIGIRNGDGKRISINADKIDFVVEQNANLTNENDIKNKFAELIDDSKKIEIKEIYDVILEETDGLKLKDIADLYFVDKYTNKQLFSLLYALCTDNTYFKQKNDLFVPKKQTEVEEKIRLEQISAEKESKEKQEKKDNIKWLKDYFYFYYAEYTKQNEKDNFYETEKDRIMFTFPPVVPNTVLKMIEPIRKYAIFGDEYEQKSQSIEVLQEIKKRTMFKMVSSQHESAFKLMKELGIFEEDENISLLKYNIPTQFKDETFEIANKIEEFHYDSQKEPNRKDLRNHYIFTIDDESTKDIDDGLSIEKIDDRYRVYIHIADVSYYVEKGSLLDESALERSTTVYLPIGKISMFPERLSEDLMSLVEGKERPALTFCMDFDEEFNKIDNSEEVIESAIIVKKRLTFLEAEGLIIDDTDENCENEDEEHNEISNNDELITQYKKYTDEERKRMHNDLNLLLEISEKLKTERINNSAIDFNIPSIKVIVDENKNITIKRIESNLNSNNIVKEMMILANVISANWCIKNNIPCIYISQPSPDEPLEIDTTKKLSRKESADVLRKMKKSEMGSIPLHHSGLGVSAYTQATSPIRRYNDLLVHRQLKSFINGRQPIYNTEEIQIVAATSEQTAKETISIERESKRYWILKYLSGMIGSTTTAFVIKKLTTNYKVLLDNTLTNAILLTSEEIEPGMVVDVKIDSIRIRQDNITVVLA